MVSHRATTPFTHAMVEYTIALWPVAVKVKRCAACCVEPVL